MADFSTNDARGGEETPGHIVFTTLAVSTVLALVFLAGTWFFI